MSSNYSEYSRLRSIARKRSERSAEAGLVQKINFPTVKQLKELGISPTQALQTVNRFLAAPTTKTEFKKLTAEQRTSIYMQTRSELSIEKKRAASRRTSQRYRERVKALTKQEKIYMKGAEKLGLHITPSQAKAFGEYMDMRFSQQSDSFRYRFANYVEDFQAIQEKKGYNTRDIVKDFNLYLNDRYGLIQHSEQMKGYTADQADRIFADWMSVNGFDSYDEDNE